METLTETESITIENLPKVYKKVVSDDAIAELKNQYGGLIINGLDDKAGYKAVHDARMICVKIRTNIETKRKELKADALEYGKAVDSEAKRLTALLAPLEEYLNRQETTIDDEIKRQREAAIEAEKERIRKIEEERQLKIKTRFEKIRKTGAIHADGGFAMEKRRVGEKLIETATDEEFENYHNDFKQLAEKKAEIKRLEEEKLAQQREEQEKERQRLEAIRKEQEEKERKLREEQEKIEAEKRRLEKEKQDAIDRENKRISDEKAAKERAIREEQLKKEAAERALREQKEKEEREKAEAEEKAAQAPDKEKMQVFIQALTDLKIPAMKSKKYKQIVNRAIQQMEVVINELKKQV